MTDTLKLRAIILEKGFVQEQLAEQLGIRPATFNYKLNNKSEFKSSEIKKLSEVLQLSEEEVCRIFFADEVE